MITLTPRHICEGRQRTLYVTGRDTAYPSLVCCHCKRWIPLVEVDYWVHFDIISRPYEARSNAYAWDSIYLRASTVVGLIADKQAKCFPVPLLEEGRRGGVKELVFLVSEISESSGEMLFCCMVDRGEKRADRYKLTEKQYSKKKAWCDVLDALKSGKVRYGGEVQIGRIKLSGTVMGSYILGQKLTVSGVQACMR